MEMVITMFIWEGFCLQVILGGKPQIQTEYCWKKCQCDGAFICVKLLNPQSSNKLNCLQEMILELLHVFSGLMRGAIMPHSLDPVGANFRNYHVWPEASPDQITPWLPQVRLKCLLTVSTWLWRYIRNPLLFFIDS